MLLVICGELLPEDLPKGPSTRTEEMQPNRSNIIFDMQLGMTLSLHSDEQGH